MPGIIPAPPLERVPAPWKPPGPCASAIFSSSVICSTTISARWSGERSLFIHGLADAACGGRCAITGASRNVMRIAVATRADRLFAQEAATDANVNTIWKDLQKRLHGTDVSPECQGYK